MTHGVSMIFWFLGCGADKNHVDEDIPWIDLASWQQLDLDLDPLAEHQPDSIDCQLQAFRMEFEQLEIQTEFCNYAALSFQTQKQLPANAQVEALLFHTGLWAIEESTAHFAFFIDGELFWEGHPPIPADSDFFFVEKSLDRAVPTGSTVYFHLHNHGVNDWKIGYIKEVNK